MLGGGAALGVDGLSSTRSASIAQYGTTNTGVTNTGTEQVAPTQTEGTTTETPSSGNLGETAKPKPAQQVQAARQVASNELPFTGYLAIPILLLGIAMLGGGLVLRRSRHRLDADL
ncbi:MAG: hypothetical protein QOI98_491 [Solirubrobacteraceae bacterium]|nr:hypothetical protein [Solirubrobacteraceae bacterium]